MSKIYITPRWYTKKNIWLIHAIKYIGLDKHNTPPSTLHNTFDATKMSIHVRAKCDKKFIPNADTVCMWHLPLWSLKEK